MEYPTMKKINYKGDKGYFITEKEKEQLIATINRLETKLTGNDVHEE